MSEEREIQEKHEIREIEVKEEEENKESTEDEEESELEQGIEIEEDFTPIGSVIPSNASVFGSTSQPVQNLEQDMQKIPSSSSSKQEDEPAYTQKASVYEQPGGNSMQRDREIAIRPSLQSQPIDSNQGMKVRQFQQQTLGSQTSMADIERDYIETKKNQGTKSKGIFGRERAF